MAGLVKAALALHHRVLPPHRGVDRPNPMLTAPESPLYLLDAADSLAGRERRAAPRRRERVRLRRHQLPRRARGVPGRVPRLAHAGDDRALAGGAAALERRKPSGPRGRASPRSQAQLATARCGSRCAISPRAWRRAAPRPRKRIAIVARDGADLAARLGRAVAHLRGEGKAPLPPGVLPRRARHGAGQARAPLPRPGLAIHRHAARAGARISRSAPRPWRKPTRLARAVRPTLRRRQAPQPVHLPARGLQRGGQGARPPGVDRAPTSPSPRSAPSRSRCCG